jgi:hypothetical protein
VYILIVPLRAVAIHVEQGRVSVVRNALTSAEFMFEPVPIVSLDDYIYVTF